MRESSDQGALGLPLRPMPQAVMRAEERDREERQGQAEKAMGCGSDPGPTGIIQSPSHGSCPPLSSGPWCSAASLTCLRIASRTLLLLVLQSRWGHRPGWGSCLWRGWAGMLPHVEQRSLSSSLLHDLGPQMPHPTIAQALPADLLRGPKSPSHGFRLAARDPALCTVRHPCEPLQGPILPCLATR